MREICERPQALSNFLRNRRADFRSRAELSSFMRAGSTGDLMEVESPATEEEIALRMVSQNRRALSLIRGRRRILDPSWRHYAEKHTGDLATLAEII
ncbi:hypothetical protein HYZ06_00555 [Candidatus Daviesbacteria bacterium]|nr:hypothetical protein [Candidatus Daviesbacteria bacterium]